MPRVNENLDIRAAMGERERQMTTPAIPGTFTETTETRANGDVSFGLEWDGGNGKKWWRGAAWESVPDDKVEGRRRDRSGELMESLFPYTSEGGAPTSSTQEYLDYCFALSEAAKKQ